MASSPSSTSSMAGVVIVAVGALRGRVPSAALTAKLDDLIDGI